MPHDPARRVQRIGPALLAPARAVRRRIAARVEATDTAARAHGWTVKELPHGGRTYRDPRFDQLTMRAASDAADTDRQEALQ